MKKTSLFFLISTLLAASATTAQIPQNRIAESWREVGVQGGIPEFSRTLLLELMPSKSADEMDDNNVSLLQNAIDAAEEGTVLYIPEGEYDFDGVIKMKSGVVLRGAGAGKTIFHFHTGNIGYDGLIQFTGESPRNNEVAVSGFEKDSVAVDIRSTDDYAVGDHIILRQNNDEEYMRTSNPSSWNQSWAERSVGQLFQVMGIDGDTLSLDRPVRYHEYKLTLSPIVQNFEPIQFAGLENFTLVCVTGAEQNSRRQDDKFNIRMRGAVNCWVSGLHLVKTDKSHFNIEQSRFIEIRGCYLDSTHARGSGGHGYGVELGYQSSDCLIEDNIMRGLRHSMMTHYGANGNVFGYNFSTQTRSDWQTPSVDISIHGHWSYMNLFEGNVVEMIESADYWGPSGHGTTFFRNRITRAWARINDRSRDNNMVGNELTGPDESANPPVSTRGGVSHEIGVSPQVIEPMVHGNNDGGELQWDDDYGSENLVDSYYTVATPLGYPDFWNPEAGETWPSIGWPNEIDSGTIPAVHRFQTNPENPTVPHQRSGDPEISLSPFPGPEGLKETFMGWLDDTAFPYVYSFDHGWLYTLPDGNGIYFFDTELDWLWTTADTYPFLYRFVDDWIYYLSENSTEASRVFYFASDGSSHEVALSGI